jgi:hypothetical protein
MLDLLVRLLEKKHKTGSDRFGCCQNKIDFHRARAGSDFTTTNDNEQKVDVGFEFPFMGASRKVKHLELFAVSTGQ